MLSLYPFSTLHNKFHVDVFKTTLIYNNNNIIITQKYSTYRNHYNIRNALTLITTLSVYTAIVVHVKVLQIELQHVHYTPMHLLYINLHTYQLMAGTLYCFSSSHPCHVHFPLLLLFPPPPPPPVPSPPPLCTLE